MNLLRKRDDFGTRPATYPLRGERRERHEEEVYEHERRVELERLRARADMVYRRVYPDDHNDDARRAVVRHWHQLRQNAVRKRRTGSLRFMYEHVFAHLPVVVGISCDTQHSEKAENRELT